MMVKDAVRAGERPFAGRLVREIARRLGPALACDLLAFADVPADLWDEAMEPEPAA